VQNVKKQQQQQQLYIVGSGIPYFLLFLNQKSMYPAFFIISLNIQINS